MFMFQSTFDIIIIYIDIYCKMDKTKKAYVDSRFRTRDSNSDSGFKFELEPLDLPDNTVCYVDDISIPHTWRTIESHDNEI